jgi:hypothetical protein
MTPEQKQEELIDLKKCVIGLRSLLEKNPDDAGVKVVERLKVEKIERLTGEIPVCASLPEMGAGNRLAHSRQLNALPSPVGVIAGDFNNGDKK